MLTGKYRGPAHNNCNLEYRETRDIVIIAHNMSGYDSHHIIRNLVKDIPGEVDLIAENHQKYISFTKKITGSIIKLRFIDSLRFLSDSLDNLASQLTKFNLLEGEFKGLEIKLLTRKGVFPYDYMSSYERLDECKLPSKSDFYSILTDCDITDDDYAHATNVWNTIGCKTLGDYSDLYMKTDIMLLADIFTNFRETSIETYELDPANYLTLPMYSFDCALKYTNVRLELLEDPDMLMFVERGIRGGLCQVVKRHAKANNKYMTNPEKQSYNPEEQSSYLAYLDINAQYSWAMTQPLPYGGFEWVDTNVDYMDVSDNAEYGYFLEVTLKYPQHLHDAHNDLPFCPEKRASPVGKQEKLMATLYDKQKYIIHHRNLKQALEHGLILEKIHRALRFRQTAWLKPYIELNNNLRTRAVTDFEKNLFKLFNNSVFGKTMQNVRNYSDIKLISKWEGRYGAEARIASPYFKSVIILDEDLVSIEMRKKEVYFCKPIYVGAAILDISKLLIYDFHYEYMSKFNCNLLYGDTDSLLYEIFTDDFYGDIKTDLHRFDTSNFEPDNLYNVPLVNKKVLGVMKDEFGGKLFYEFIGLSAKLYTCRSDSIVIKKAKGVRRNFVNNALTFEDYLDCLTSSKTKTIDQNLIQSKNHEVCTITQRKVALSNQDDKRYLIPNSYETLAWGNHRIMM